MAEERIDLLHCNTDTQRNNARIRRILVVFGACTLVAVALIVGSLIWRDNTRLYNPRELTSQIITIAVTLVWGAVIIFFWGMKMTPLLAYRRYLRELRSGLTREVEGLVVSVDEKTTYRDGISAYGLIVNIGNPDEPEDERLLYWDAQLGAPPIAEGDFIHCRAHGNDIIGYRKLAGR